MKYPTEAEIFKADIEQLVKWIDQLQIS